MVFEVKNKVAIVTGGASGIGLSFVKHLLKSGVRGVVIADVNVAGKQLSEELNKEFGSGKVIFVLTDVSDHKSFENAFIVALNNFKNIDILINNAGICIENQWEREIDVNLKGSIGGMILGMEKYLRNHKQGDEAVILNVSSVSVVQPAPMIPVYISTKCGVLGMTRSWGVPFHYNRTKVRVIAICPGMTETPILENVQEKFLSDEYIEVFNQVISGFEEVVQGPDHVGKASIPLLEHAPNGSAWIIEGCQDPYELKLVDKCVHKDNLLKIDV